MRLGTLALYSIAWVGSLLLSPFPSTAGTTGFVENRGQVNEAVLYYAPMVGAMVYFTPTAVVMDLRKMPAPESLAPGGSGEHGLRRGCAIYAMFANANPSPVIDARGPLATTFSFFTGTEAGAWRTQVPAFAEIVYHDLWPGVDLVFHEEGGSIVYEAIAHPGSIATPPAFLYEGSDGVTSEETPSELRGDKIMSPVGSLIHESSGLSGEFRRDAEGFSTGSDPDPTPAQNPALLLWSTFMGGNDLDQPYVVAIDKSGDIIVAGTSNSTDFPTTPGAYDTTWDFAPAFISRLSPSGSELLWSTFLGVDTRVYDLALVSSGDIVLTGSTRVETFPTTEGAFDRSFSGREDAFVTKLSSTGSALVWSTLLGGESRESIRAVALDGSENIVVTGTTSSGDYPTTPGSYQTSPGSSEIDDAFVSKLSSSGSELLWSTFLGGSVDDACVALTLDSAGNPVVTGETLSSDFPTTPGAYDRSRNGSWDAFVSKLSATGSALLWSTFLGGDHSDSGVSLQLDGAGNAIILGDTDSPGFPVTPGAFDTSFEGTSDCFVATISSTGSALLWSTLLGGNSYEEGHQLALDVSGSIVVTGATASADFPVTQGGYDIYFTSASDVFVSKLSSTGSHLLWGTFLGGNSVDSGFALVLDGLGNAVVAGTTISSTFPTTPGAYDRSFAGFFDAFVSKLQLGRRFVVEVGSTHQGDPLSSGPTAEVAGTPDGAGLMLEVYSAQGRRVRQVPLGDDPTTLDQTIWDGRYQDGRPAPSGVYFLRMVGGSQEIHRKTVLVR